MPLYVMHCKACGNEEEIIRRIASMDDDLPVCCGNTMSRKIVAANIQADYTPFRSIVDGSVVSGRKQHREHMKRHGLVEVGNEKLTKKATKKFDSDPSLKTDIAETLSSYGV